MKHCEINLLEQEMLLLEHGSVQKRYRISSGKMARANFATAKKHPRLAHDTCKNWQERAFEYGFCEASTHR